jgi:hypothetical protein
MARSLNSRGSNTLGLLNTNLDTIVLFVPGLERSGINLDDGVLHQSLGTHQLVVGGVVHNIKDTSLVGGDYHNQVLLRKTVVKDKPNSAVTFRSPGEVAGLKAKSTVLEVTTSHADNADSWYAKLGHGRGTTRLVESLLLQVGLAAATSSALVSTVTRNSCTSAQYKLEPASLKQLAKAPS